MKTSGFKLAMCMLMAAVCLAGCSSEPPKPAQPVAQKPAKPETPPQVQAAAEAALGSETEVLAYGDLALTGKQHVLAVNRLRSTPAGVTPGILFTRAVVVANDRGKWQELFRCDEYLKNTNGFLAGTPLLAINGWRLQFEQDKAKGLVMYFTPMREPASGKILAIGVRWNAKAGRYQSLDRSYTNFLGESRMLEKPETQLR